MKCFRDYTANPKPHYRTDTVDTAIVLYAELKNYREVGRLLGLHHQTVINWVKDSGTRISWILDRPPIIQDLFDKRVKRLLKKAYNGKGFEGRVYY